MTKHTKDFKLSVVAYYKSGDGGSKSTAAHFGIDHSLVRKWVSQHEQYGEEGLEKRATKSIYSVELKKQVIFSILHEGLSLREAARQFRVREHSTVLDWIRCYDESGIEALQPKRRGRRAVMKKPKPKYAKQDKQKSQEELLEELAYLRAENAYLKKVDALIREKQAQQNEQQSSQD
jgi:transposase